MSEACGEGAAAKRFGRRAALEALPGLASDANKYTRGTVLVAGGSAAYPGAAILAARAASRAGAGYVRLAAPQDAAAVAQHHLCSIPVSACSQQDGALCADAAAEVLAAGGKSNVFVVGPGLTRTQGAEAFLCTLLAQLDKPVVLDADALNILAAHPELSEHLTPGKAILTPHEGEAARLLGHAVEDRAGCVRELAGRYRATVVLKGPKTLIGAVSGTLYECDNAGPELAKAGTGDVLAGIIGALVAQGAPALEAAALAVYLHGSAGKLAARRVSAYAVTPEDVVESIGPAVLELIAGQGCSGSEL